MQAYWDAHNREWILPAQPLSDADADALSEARSHIGLSTELSLTSIQILEELASRNPDNLEIQASLGDALMELGRIDEAMLSYRRTITIGAPLFPSQRIPGEYEHEVGTIEVDRPQNRALFTAVLRLAILEFDRQDYGSARPKFACLYRALKRDALGVSALYVSSLAAEGCYRDVIECTDCEDVFARIENRYTRGLAFAEMGCERKAKMALAQAVVKAPSFAELLQNANTAPPQEPGVGRNPLKPLSREHAHNYWREMGAIWASCSAALTILNQINRRGVHQVAREACWLDDGTYDSDFLDMATQGCYERIRTQLLEHAEAIGWNDIEWANASGVSASTVSGFRAGARKPSIDTLLYLAHGIGMTLELDLAARVAKDG